MSHDDVQKLAEELEVRGVFAEAEAEHRRRLEADPEWTTPHWLSAQDVVRAFLVGVVDADPPHRPYRLPPGTQAVADWIAACAERAYGGGSVQRSVLQVEDELREWAVEHPGFRAWNGDPHGPAVAVVTRADARAPLPAARDFIDLDALLRNAAVHLWDRWRDEDAFNRDFDERWRQRHPKEAP